MKGKADKKKIKKDLKRLFKSMDFVADNYLNQKDIPEKELSMFYNIYQQLGLAWEYLGLKCGHWDGFRKTKDHHEVCKICGKNRQVDDMEILLPVNGQKKIGRKLTPDSKKIFKNKAKANIIKDSIKFHGAKLGVDVHNAYKSNLFDKKHEINIAAERIVQLKESNVKCSISKYTIHIQLGSRKQKKDKPKYGAFAFEMTKRDLKHLPIVFDFDENDQFSGMTILR